jgi:dUTP pyrophosphatase
LADNEAVKQFYATRCNFADDAGVDLYVPSETVIAPFKDSQVTMVSMKVRCRMVDENNKTVSYYLYPRSSISKTPLLLANSVGVIDQSYTGEIIAALRNLSDVHYKVERGTRIVQICAPDLSPLRIRLVDSLDETERGAGGFGSTMGRP